MKKNMSNIDRVVRTAIAATVAILYFTSMISGVLGALFLTLSVIFLTTSFFSFCPIYALFGISSCKVKEV